MPHPTLPQTEPRSWPSGHGEVMAVLQTSPEALAERHGLRFFEGHDNLDAYEAVSIRLRSGREVGLLRHRGDPLPGVEVHGDSGDDPEQAVAELLHALGMSWSACSWIREPQVHPAHSAAASSR